MEQGLLSYIETKKDELIQISQTLVQQNSCNPPGDVSNVAAAAVDIIQKTIPEAQVSTYISAPGIENVVAIVRGLAPGPSRRLVFSGHLDTYPVGEEKAWSFPPLGATFDQEAKRLYGRGASDMKGGIAASIIAASALAQHRYWWSGEVVLALAGDEETMGTLGTAYLLENVDSVRLADAVICGDAGSPKVPRIGEKGLVWVDIAATGIAAHGAHVHRGKNAIERLLEAITALRGLEGLSIDTPPEIQEIIAVAKATSEPLGGTGEADTLQRITVNVGVISGGVSANLVPDQAHAAADIRLPMGITTTEVVEYIDTALKPLAGITYEIRRRYDASWTSPSTKIVQESCSAINSIMQQDAVVNMRVGASDTRLFRQKGIPSVVIGLTPYNMGGPDEYFEVQELLQVAQIHALAAWRFLN